MTSKDVSRLVVRALNSDADDFDQAQAFDEIVRRFQDMAFACAYAVLRDRALAEEAAQDAFLTAWLNLDRLRNREAFPGWFRRIVLSQCSRRLRSLHPTVPLEAAMTSVSPAESPETRAERSQLSEPVRDALNILPEHERMTILLFYAGHYSLKEIAAFLDVSVTAVKQRLFSARRKLKARITAMTQDDLRDQRPSGSDAFADGVRARLRHFESTDYDTLVSLADAVDPDTQANAVWLQNRHVAEGLGLERRAYVIEDTTTGDVLAFGAIEQDPTEPGHRLALVTAHKVAEPGDRRYRLFLVAPHSAFELGAAGLLYEKLMSDAAELGVTELWARDLAGDETLGFLYEKGFLELNRLAHWRLALDAWRTNGAGVVPSVEITTLILENDVNPNYLAGLVSFWNAPETAAMPLDGGRPYDAEYVSRRLSMPDVEAASYFIARRAGRVVGVLNLRRPHVATPERADLWVSVLLEKNGRGLSEALLAGAVSYARAHAIATLQVVLRTDTHSAIAFFEHLGFVKQAEMVLVEKAIDIPGVVQTAR